MADRAEWQRAVEAELRTLGRELGVPPATDLTAAVRQRLEEPAGRRRHVPVLGAGALRRWRLGWRVALVVAGTYGVVRHWLNRARSAQWDREFAALTDGGGRRNHQS